MKLHALLPSLLFIAAIGVQAQTTVSVSITVPTAAAKDVEQYRLTQIAGQTTLQGAINTSQTTLVLANPNLAANTAILINNEPMLITANSSGTYTVTRNAALAVLGSSAAAHADQSTVSVLVFPTALATLKNGLALWMKSVIASLGTNSAVMGTQLTAIQNAQSTINSATDPNTLVQ